MISVSSMILISSMACILVRVEMQVFCYRCSTKKGESSFCDKPTFIFSSSCASNLCSKVVEYENGVQVYLRRRCSSDYYALGCRRDVGKSSDTYTESCYCDSSYCNKAVKFTWSLFVNLSLVVSSLFAMF